MRAEEALGEVRSVGCERVALEGVEQLRAVARHVRVSANGACAINSGQQLTINELAGMGRVRIRNATGKAFCRRRRDTIEITCANWGAAVS